MSRYCTCLFISFMLLVTFASTSLAQTATNDVKHIKLVDLATTKVRGSIYGPWKRITTQEEFDTWKRPRRVISQEEFEAWLLRLGELKPGQKFSNPTEPDYIPTKALIFPLEYRDLTHRFSNTVNPVKILDKLEENPDKERPMTPDGGVYKNFLGENWTELLIRKKLELVVIRIYEDYDRYRHQLGTWWADSNGIIIGINYFDVHDKILTGPKEIPLDSSEFLDLLRRSMGYEYPFVLKDEVIAGKRCIVIDSFYCFNIPIQYSCLIPSFQPKLRVIGKIDQQIVFHADNQLFLYDLNTKTFERQIMDMGQELQFGIWQQMEIGLLNRTLYLLTATQDKGGGSTCVLRKGVIE